jgi:hypothetical protein
MTDYSYDYQVDKEIEALESSYDLESLKYRRESLTKTLTKINANIGRFLRAYDEQIKVVEGTEFKPEVYIDRRTNYDNKVEFTVGVKFLPQLASTGDANRDYFRQNRLDFPSKETKRFTGQERRAALAYADELAKKHNAEIIKGGWGWKDKKAA